MKINLGQADIQEAIALHLKALGMQVDEKELTFKFHAGRGIREVTVSVDISDAIYNDSLINTVPTNINVSDGINKREVNEMSIDSKELDQISEDTYLDEADKIESNPDLDIAEGKVNLFGT